MAQESRSQEDRSGYRACRSTLCRALHPGAGVKTIHLQFVRILLEMRLCGAPQKISNPSKRTKKSPYLSIRGFFCGAASGNRTRTLFLARDFKSLVSTSSTMAAGFQPNYYTKQSGALSMRRGKELEAKGRKISRACSVPWLQSAPLRR